MKSELTDTEGVAEKLHTSPSTVRYWRHMGTGPKWAKVGRRVLYRVEDVEAWLEDRFRESAHAGGDAA